jgi:phage tail-like protein
MHATGERIDYLTAYHFTVEVEGIAQAQFTECSGLQAEAEVFSYEEGGCNDYVHKLPGRIKFSNLTFMDK